MLLCPVSVQGPKIGNDHRPIPAPDHHFRGQGHRIEETVARCAISTRVVGGGSSNDEGSLDATVDQIECRLHREAGCRHRCIEGAGRNATILRIQPSAAGRRSLPDTLDVARIMDPGKGADRVLVREAAGCHDPPPNDLRPARTARRAPPGPVAASRDDRAPVGVPNTAGATSRSEAYRESFSHDAMIANGSQLELGMRNEDMPAHPSPLRDGLVDRRCLASRFAANRRAWDPLGNRDHRTSHRNRTHSGGRTRAGMVTLVRATTGVTLGQMAKKAIRIGVSLALMVVLLAVFLWNVDFQEVGRSLAGADLRCSSQPPWLRSFRTGCALSAGSSFSVPLVACASPACS